VFAFGALVAIPAGAQAGGFSDLTWLLAILAVLSIFGWHEKKRREAKQSSPKDQRQKD
jgi:hypothetical protein